VPETLAICLLASEVEPLSKTGGLADVAGALGKYLHANGHDVRLFTPCYASIDPAAFGAQAVAGLTRIPLTIGSRSFVFSVLRAHLPGGACVYLIDCPALYARATIYTADADEHVRFLALTRAALISCQRLRWSPHIVHCNDWHTAFAPLYLQAVWRKEQTFARTRSLLTIHNIGYQGIFPASQVADVGLSGSLKLLHQDDLAAGRVNPLRHGILYADAINTVSPTHAREICTDTYGMGLQDSLRMRAADGALSGILNGVDYEEWDPRTDRYLPQHYDADTLQIKAQLKQQLLHTHQLEPAAADVPLVGLVSRLAAQKGIELLFDSLPRVLAARPLSCVVLGDGEPQYEAFFTALAQSFPGRVHFHCGYDEALAHWIEAASDMFLMPSRYEPCGLNQMYSLRYGTVPIVRRTGGLADSVQHFDPHSGEGTGIVFNDFDTPAAEWALNTALDWYAQRQLWSRLVQNGMACDFSWQRQAGEYLALYQRLIAG
jgi:starch synthase